MYFRNKSSKIPWAFVSWGYHNCSFWVNRHLGLGLAMPPFLFQSLLQAAAQYQVPTEVALKTFTITMCKCICLSVSCLSVMSLICLQVLCEPICSLLRRRVKPSHVCLLPTSRGWSQRSVECVSIYWIVFLVCLWIAKSLWGNADFCVLKVFYHSSLLLSS